MKNRNMPHGKHRRATRWTGLILAPALLWTGCATQPATPEVTAEEFRAVQLRMEDVERTNGRLMVRVEELERQAALMQDRVEANRLALQRQGALRQREETFAAAPRQEERPQPAPRTDYTSPQNYHADPTMRQRMEQRGVARIQLSDQQSGHVDGFDDSYFIAAEELAAEASEEEIVITNEILDRYFGSEKANRPTTRQAPSAPAQTGRRAQPPVTDERLSTSRELNAKQNSEKSAGDALVLYQDSLALYRAGNYARALEGFTEFLDGGQRPDYVDNALYWIGECHYGMGQYERSVDFFKKIINEMPSAGKVPDAMLKMSLAFERMGQNEKASETLMELLERYPRSNPAILGAQRLQESSRGSDG